MTDGVAFPKERPYRDAKARAFYRQRHPKCEGCAKQRSAEVHHLRSRQMGGSDEDRNLLALCPGCHRDWTKPDGTRREWLAARTKTMTAESIVKVEDALAFAHDA